MTAASSQLPLGLSLRSAATFDNFYIGKNAEIIDILKKAATGIGERIIYLCGIKDTGCSHLLQAACHFANELQHTSIYLPLKELSALPCEILQGFENYSLVCIDDLQVIAGMLHWEEAIFHLFNRLYDNNACIITAAHDLPKALKIKLADLQSRLEWGIIQQVHALNDEEKIKVLIMKANARGMFLAEDVGRFILNHVPRHLDNLFNVLDALDNASLVAKRKLTIPFIKEVLHLK